MALAYTVGLLRAFVAEHRLVGGDWGKENERHSHPYRLEVVFEGDTLDKHGYLIDISESSHRWEDREYFTEAGVLWGRERYRFPLVATAAARARARASECGHLVTTPETRPVAEKPSMVPPLHGSMDPSPPRARETVQPQRKGVSGLSREGSLWQIARTAEPRFSGGRSPTG